MKKIINSILGLTVLLTNSIIGQEAKSDKWLSARPDGHAPISVMGDHVHKKGEFMFSYRFMPMRMEGNLNGTDDISNQGIQSAGFRVAPQEMTMNMHMLGAMYAPSDHVTLMVMANYISNSMTLRVLMNGLEFDTESGGLGDTMIGGLVKIMNKNKQALHANIGLSIPTGSLEEEDFLPPLMRNQRLAYTMQTGSGTFDPSLGITYLGQTDLFSWGAQVTYKTRLGENSEDYTLGDKASGVAWGAIKASSAISFSASVSYFKQGDIDGVDPAFSMLARNNVMPLFNTNNSGRSQLDLGLGANYLFTTGALKNLRVAVEAQLPVAQEVNGIQMKNELMGTFGIQYAIGNHSSH